MKTEEIYKNKNIFYNQKPEIIDDFWKDCIDFKDKKESKNKKNLYESKQNTKSKNVKFNRYQYSKYHPSKEKDSNGLLNKEMKSKGYYNIKPLDPKIKRNNYNNNVNPLNEKYLALLYNRHPSLIEEQKEEKNNKIRSKNAVIRCIGLYAYGLELLKTNKINKENSEQEKIRDDITKCTFKPKLNPKISYLNNKAHYIRGVKRLYKPTPKKIMNKSLDDVNKNSNIKKQNINNNKNSSEECTFKPKFESDPNAINKMFKKKNVRNKKISDERENAEFILRYTKARDEHLIKRFKKLYKKDDSYDYSLLNITRRLCNKEYKNYLNVNNTIYLFGETITPNNHNLQSSIADFRGLPVGNESAEQKKEKNKNYIISLRKNLHSLDLNESGED